MLSFFERVQKVGGLSRRQFLSAGAIGGGLTLARLLAAEEASGIRSSHKAVINIHLDGGPPQMDLIDLKPKATPADIAPPFVDLMQGRPLVRNSARPGFLGPTYGPFRPDISQMFERQLEDKMVIELASKGDGHATSLALSQELSQSRLQDRTSLRTGLDRLRGQVDRSGMMDAVDSFNRQAVGILTSGRFAAAMDLSREDPRAIERYTLQAASGEPPSTTS